MLHCMFWLSLQATETNQTNPSNSWGFGQVRAILIQKLAAAELALCPGALTVPSLPEMLRLQPIPNKPGLVFPVERKSLWGVPILCRGLPTASERSPVPVGSWQHRTRRFRGACLARERGCSPQEHPWALPLPWSCRTPLWTGTVPLTFSVEQLAVPVHVCQEEAVDQGGFAQPGFPWESRTKMREQPGSPSPVQGVWDAKWGQCPQAGWSPVPATMRVKSKPFFTDLRCTWLGSVAKPTYSLSSCRGHRGHGTGTPPAHLLR